MWAAENPSFIPGAAEGLKSKQQNEKNLVFLTLTCSWPFYPVIKKAGRQRQKLQGHVQTQKMAWRAGTKVCSIYFFGLIMLSRNSQDFICNMWILHLDKGTS